MAQSTVRPDVAVAPAGSAGLFLRHAGEMVLAMVVGMAIFGMLFSGVLLAFGTTYQEVLDAAPVAIAVVQAFNMSAPMVLWMRHRGHPEARVAEMGAVMFLAPAVTATALLWSGAIDSTAICGVECAVMLPAMVGVMLLRRDEYARH